VSPRVPQFAADRPGRRRRGGPADPGGQGGNHIGVTPDGPRGPRRQVQAGVVYLASWTGLCIIPVGVGYRNPWRLRSWDCFAVPRPGSDATVIAAEPIFVPPNLDREAVEQYRLRLEQALADVSADAEHWANRTRGQAPRADVPATVGRGDVQNLLHGTHSTGNGHATTSNGRGPRDFALAPRAGSAMSMTPVNSDAADRPPAIPVLENRCGTLLGGRGRVVVFTIAVLLDPYQADGCPTMETHQMGLPACTFKTVTL
jgi:hypothetical protein